MMGVGARIQGRLDNPSATAPTLVPVLASDLAVMMEAAGFGRHAEGCSRAHGARYRCRCGWASVLDQLGWPDREALAGNAEETAGA
jgi:hypothetical protein